MTDHPDIPPMVEKVAFAVFCTWFHSDDVASGLVAKMWVANEYPDCRRRAYRSAQAALTALADPPPEMVEAGARDLQNKAVPCDHEWLARGTFKAMIAQAKGGA